MKKFIKLLIVLLGIAYETNINAQITVNPMIDNIKYWVELAELGYIPFNPEVEIPESHYKGTQIQTPFGFASSPDVVLTNTGINTQSENSVFVNPTNNQIILNSNNSINGTIMEGYTNGIADALISVDGGVSWSGSISAVGNYENRGDPAVAVDLNGNSFIGYMDHTSANNPTMVKGQAISKSSNNGISWTEHVIDDGFISSVNILTPVLDKNHLWVDNSPLVSNQHTGNLYSAWTYITGSNSNYKNGEIDLSRSTDGGNTWTTVSGISCAANSSSVPCHSGGTNPQTGSPYPINGDTHQGVNIQTGPLGEVYAVWAIINPGSPNENALGFAKSVDGGVNFAPAVRIENNSNFSLASGTNINGIRWFPPSSNPNNISNPIGKDMRTNSFPCMAVDITPSGTGTLGTGNIYVVWANEGDPNNNNIGTDISVYMIKSTDGGTTWTDPIRVNQDPLGNKQFFPWITCDPTTGELSVIFYDDRDVGSAELETWVAVSRDNGDTWQDFRVSDVAFTPTPIPNAAADYMGDYLGISARDGKVYPVWTDNRTGVHLAYTSPFCLSCQPDLLLSTTVPASTVDHQAAYFTITAENIITTTADAVYLAGDEVLMQDGFQVEGGAEYRAYIDICNGNFVKSAPYDPNEPIFKPKKKKPVSYFEPKDEHVKLGISPNPTDGIFKVVLSDGSNLETFELKIYSMSGGLVYRNRFEGNEANRFDVDISKFRTGVYFIELVNSKNNLTYSGKIVKN